jgi:hypothetical protein
MIRISSSSPEQFSLVSNGSAVLDALNFDSGVAGDFTLDILQHLVKKESVCDNLHNRYEDGQKLQMQGDLPKEPSSK